MISYEYPLNERIRTLLRLEDLFLKIAHFTAGAAPQDHHVALLTTFETLEVASRADLKVDLVQELERQRQILMRSPRKPLPARYTRSSRPRPGCWRWRARSGNTCARTNG